MNAFANIKTIAKRELSAYFASPVAYVFIVIFLLLAGFFTFMIGHFFEIGQASLRSFFMWHPWLYLFLVPAAGMRLWSEERRSGTMELLLTMPITPWQAIVGKFLASWIFLGIALVLTFPIVFTVNYLGTPDNGVIVTSYLGSFLLAGTYLAISCMTSAITRNQVVSFILSVVICFLLILVGYPPVTNFLYQVLGFKQGLVETIAAFSVMTHFNWLQLGVVDSRDAIFFLSVIVFSLFTTGVIIREHRTAENLTKMKKNSFETILYSVAGVIILLVILIAFNALTSTVKQRVDFTQDKAYTLSSGTKAILGKLDTPVKIRFYYSSGESDSGDTMMLKTYAQHVADLLDEYKQAAKGKLIVEQYDPKPDSDAEDSARLDGVEGQLLPNGEKFYMGLCVSMLDSKEAIPFLDPERERLLEYDLSRAITRVVTPDKPVIGVMSALPVFGTPGNPMMAQFGQGSQGEPAWVFINELKSDYDVKQVEMTSTRIDDNIKVLIVIHPKDITDQTQYAIDQFLMRGGKLIAFLDATSVVDRGGSSPLGGQMPGGGSSLNKLLKAWGIQFDMSKVVVDMNYKLKIMGRSGQPEDAPAFLDITSDGLDKDDVATSEVQDIWYALGGAFTGMPVAGLKETVLAKTTKDSELVDGMMASLSGDNIIKDFKPSGIQYPLAIRLTGKFKTAFPDGAPKESKDDTKPDDKPAATPPGETLKETKGDGSVVLFGDADMIYDQFCVRQRQTILGPMGYEPANGNLIVAQNLVDQLASDSNLISVRSRAASDRPFTRINAMKTKAEESYQSRINEFEQSLQETQNRVNELQSKKGQGEQKFILSPEQQTELDNLKKKQVAVNIQLKAERKKLTRDISSLENTLEWGNIIAMPAIVALSGIGLALIKRKRTSAK